MLPILNSDQARDIVREHAVESARFVIPHILNAGHLHFSFLMHTGGR